MKYDEAIILAGGLGTRLKSVIPDIPKPMAPIDDRPFLEFLLSYLSVHNIKHVVLSVGYRQEVIQSHFGKTFKGMELTYAVEEEPLGTGGALRYSLQKVHNDAVYLLNGDTFFNVDLRDLQEFFNAFQCDIAMSVRLMHHISRYGTVEVDRSRVKGFNAKRLVERGFINGGVYLIRNGLLDEYLLPEKFSFESDFLEEYAGRLRIHAMETSAYFIDIGIPEDYKKARTELPGLF